MAKESTRPDQSSELPLPPGVSPTQEVEGYVPEDDVVMDDDLDMDVPLTADADVFDAAEELVSLEDMEEEDPDDVIGEDDDNPYLEPDDALPTDEEESAISRDTSRERTRFDEI